MIRPAHPTANGSSGSACRPALRALEVSPPSGEPENRATDTRQDVDALRVTILQLRHDLPGPRRTCLGIGCHDYIVIAKDEIVPDCRIEVMVVNVMRFLRPGYVGQTH
jgi:hypothetical protein